ncbi:hypothetical protein [Kriegella aquimaris]|uniref:Uncharacterized protein n=1 Tax=Kriegella aquimaris TaxID=192904 RepID=A0A1G9NP81_9FLAO|nr:hypothetical protein [Kriegella aquimaris]SDL88398.1 hypothetical protein SAMN04488514_103270 [Kriegella aquimaris]
MRSLKLFLVFLIGTNLAFNQVGNDTTKSNTISMNEWDYEDKIAVIENQETKFLTEKNELLEAALISNSNIFDGITVFFGLITILLTILAISIPFFNYFYVIKPNRELKSRLEELEIEIPGTIEKNFASFYRNYEKSKFKGFLKKLKEDGDYKELADFVDANHPFYKDFEQEDQRTIVEFLKGNPEIDSSSLPALNRILMDRPSEISTLFFKNTFEIENNQNYKFALEYLVDEGSSEHFNFLKKEIKNSSNGHCYMLDILEFSQYYYLNKFHDISKGDIGIKIVKKYFDNEEICESLKEIDFPKSRESKYSFVDDVLVKTKYEDNPFLTATLYFKLFLVNKLTKPTSFLRI